MGKEESCSFSLLSLYGKEWWQDPHHWGRTSGSSPFLSWTPSSEKDKWKEQIEQMYSLARFVMGCPACSYAPPFLTNDHHPYRGTRRPRASVLLGWNALESRRAAALLVLPKILILVSPTFVLKLVWIGVLLLKTKRILINVVCYVSPNISY